MAQDQYRYVINTELKLKAGSLNKLLEDIREVDKTIKAHFEKAGGGVRVPVTVDKNTTRLQGEIKRVVDGYNKGQAPHIKIPVSIDETSIKKLQERINALKHQLNNISNDKKTISVNTSLEIGKGEREKVQRQVGDTKATMSVGLRLNENDIKIVKSQIESIKAEIKASVNSTRATQPQSNGTVGRFNGRDNNSVGTVASGGNGRILFRKDRADRFIAERQQIMGEIRSIKENEKLLNSELKELMSKSELENRIAQLEAKKANPKSKQHDFKDSNGNVIKGSRVYAKDYDSTINDYKQAMQKVDEATRLQAQLQQKESQLVELERKAQYGQKNYSNLKDHHPLAQLNSQNDAKRKAEETRKQKAIDDTRRKEEARQREIDSKHRTAEAMDRKREAQRIADAKKANQPYNVLNTPKTTSARQSKTFEQIQAEQLKRDVNSAQNSALKEDRKRTARQLNPIQKTPKSVMSDEERQARELYREKDSAWRQAIKEGRRRDAEKYYGPVRTEDKKKETLQREIDSARKQAEKEDRIRQARKTQGPVTQKEIDRARIQAENEDRKRTARAIEEARKPKTNPADALREKAEQDRQKEIARARIQAEKEDRKREAKKYAQQQAEQRAIQSAQNNPLNANNGSTQLKANQRRAVDYNQGIHRYGGNREFQAIDLEAKLRNPNVGREETYKALSQLHAMNQKEAYDSKKNFQKSYGIQFRNEDGTIQNLKTLTFEYSKLGDMVERGDRSMQSMARNMMQNTLIYTAFTASLYAMVKGFTQAVQQIVEFDSKLAQVGIITQQLGTENLNDFYKGSGMGAGTSSIQTNISNQAFEMAQKYGVSASDTVLPVETQVLGRKNLIKGENGKADPALEKKIVDNIVKFSAVSTGGNASAEETNAIGQDVLSLYQAMYSPDEYNNKTNHIGKMDDLLNFMAILKSNNVNTGAVTDSLSELAPDTIKKGMDPKMVAGMLGAYNQTDIDATSATMTQIGKLFFGSLAKPNNPQVQKALEIMDIDTTKKEYNTTPKLVEAVMEKFPQLLSGKQSEVAENLAGLTGKSSAMTPKMVKFLEAISNGNVQGYMKQNKETPNALDKSWDTFSGTLKKHFNELGEQVKELVQQFARLGLADFLGVALKTLTAFLNSVNGVLHGLTKLSDFLSDNHTFNFVKMGVEVAGVVLAFKALSGITNKLNPGMAGLVGDFFERNTGRRAGFRSPLADAGTVLANGTVIPTTAPRTGAPLVIPTTGPRSRANIAQVGTIAGSMLPLSTPINHGPVNSRDVRTINGTPSHYGPTTRQGNIQVLNQTASAMRPPNAVVRGANRIGGSSVGRFLGDALFISSFRNGSAQRTGAEVVNRGGGVLKGLFEWIGKSLPAMRGFALLLTRLSLVGGALALAWWGASKVIENANKRKSAYNKEQAEAVNKNSEDMLKSKNKFEKHQGKIQSAISDVRDFTKKSQSPTYVMDPNENKKQFDLREDLKKQYGIELSTNAKGQTIAMYHLVDSKGGLSDKTYKANLDTKKGANTFDTALENGFRNQTKTVKDMGEDWTVNTDYLMNYNQALAETSDLTKEISRTTKMLGFNIEGIDAKYFGTNSTSALREKISTTKSSLNNITDERSRLNSIKSQIVSNKNSLDNDLSKQIQIALDNGVSSKSIEEVKQNLSMRKFNGTTDDFLDDYSIPTENDIKEWKKDKKDKNGKVTEKGMTKEEVDSKLQESKLLQILAQILLKASGFADAEDQITDATIQQEQAIRQNEQAMKEYTAQLLVASSGIGVMEAQISKINSAVGMGRAMVQMAEPNSKEQKDAQGSMIKISSELLKGYRAELGSVNNTLSNIKSQNPNQDFSLNYLYNPGEEGLTAQQQAYKELLEKQNSIQDSVSSTTVDVYEQAQQLKEMVLNSDKYADVWERVQNRTQLVKDANKEIYNMQNDLAMVDSMSQIRSALTGQSQSSIKQGKLEQIRDRGIDTYEQLMSALRNYDGDADKLSEAYDEINKTMGSEFDKAFISPLKDLIKNDFDQAGNKILQGADSLNTVLGNWAKFAMESASNPSSVAGQTEAFNNAMSIPSYGEGNGNVSNMSSDQKLDAYIEQMGYKKGTKEFAQMRRQMQTTMSQKEIDTEVNKSLTVNSKGNVAGANAGAYTDDINDYFSKTNRSKLKGYGSEFVTAGAKYGIDPRFLAAIAVQETGGTSRVIDSAYNIGNIKGTGKSNAEWDGSKWVNPGDGLTYRKYGSMQEGINDLARLLKDVYFSQGLTSIPAINGKYAEDPNWKNGVASIYSGISGISVSSLLGGQTISSSKGGGTAVSSGGSRSTVRLGSKGDDVKALQKALGISADGIFGKQTLSAVKKYQSSHGLDADGIVGSKTWSKLGIGGTKGSTATSGAKGTGGMSVLSSLINKSPTQGGLAYSWGGGHDSGDWDSFIKKAKADCSGLVQHFYREFAGVELGTGSSNSMWQNNQGTRITDKSKLQVGDVVYFGSGGKVTHTGIYAGDGKYIGMNSGGPNRGGAPLKEDKMRSDFVGGKRYDGANAKLTTSSSSPLTNGQATKEDILKQAVGAFMEAMNAEAELRKVQPMKDAYYRDAKISYGKGNIRDILGTSGRTAVYDRIGAERENVYEQRFEVVEQLKQLNVARKNYATSANTALKKGNKTDYQTNKDAVASIDKLIKTLTETNKELAEWDKKLSDQQKNDPRLNRGYATNYIRGGYDKIRSMSNDVGSADYMRVADEINRMNSEYMTLRNQTNTLGQLWANSGVGTQGYSMIKRQSDQEDINILFQKITAINGVLNDFAQGTQAWYSALENAVAVQKELNDLEQQRLQNAKDMFDLTGKGLDGYIQQSAYTTSKERTQAKSNLNSAVSKYKSKEMDDTYKTQIGTGHYSKETAQKIQEKLKDKYGVGSSIVQNKDTGDYYVNTQGGLTKEKADEIQKGILKDGLGVKYSGTKKDKDGGKMDANEELANLQIIAGMHDQLISGMDEYRQAVVGAFKAGALSLEEYMKRMNDLRDVQNEAKENAIQLVDALSQGFQEAFASALSSGMQGNMDSVQGFIDSMKQSFASSISSAIASSVFNNSGLLDVTNSIIGQIAGVVAGGDPTEIANMFNNNDFGQQFQDALAPFLPLIQQIIASTDGMFAIMKDQMFNAPQGFKIDSMLYGMAKGKDFEGVKNWDSSGKNGAGSSDSPTTQTTGGGGETPISITPVTDPSSGTPSGTSGTGAKGTSPSTTASGGTGAPDTSKDNKTPDKDNTKIDSPAPPKKSSSGHKHGTLRQGAKGSDVKEIQKAVGVKADGIWGPKTTQAVKAFQKKHGLSADGIVGPKTWAEIHKTNGGGGSSSGSSSGGSSGGGGGGSNSTKTVKTALNFRSSPSINGKVIQVLPKGAKVSYYGIESGWAKVGYKGKTGYVGRDYIYHSGGLAGLRNFSSPNGLKPDEISAILKQGEGVFTQKQISSLVGGNTQTNNGGDVNFNITVNVEGGQDSGALQATVETAVKRAIQEVKRDQRFNNLTWKGTSY